MICYPDKEMTLIRHIHPQIVRVLDVGKGMFHGPATAFE